MLNIDEMVKKGLLHKEFRIMRYDLDWQYGYGQHVEQEVDTDEMPISIPSTSLSYKDVILADNPKHYWRLGESTATTVMVDEVAVGAANGAYNVNANTAGFNVTGAVYVDANSAKRFGYGARNATVAGAALGYGVPNANVAFSFECWIKMEDNNTSRHGIFDWYSITSPSNFGSQRGFSFFVENMTPKLNRFGTGGQQETIVWGGSPMTAGTYYHVAYTITTTGLATAYLNGQRVQQTQLATHVGLVLPATGTAFNIAKTTSQVGVVTNYSVDELVLYSTVVTGTVIQEHYTQAIVSFGIGGGVNFGNPPIYKPPVSSLVPPNLINGEDVTHLVSKWTVTKDQQSHVTSATLTLHDKWAYTDARTKLGTGAYVTIENRYKNESRGWDTGWIQIAHVISGGPVRRSLNTQGQKEYTCAANGLMKFLSIDVVNYNIEGDTIRVPRKLATRTYSDGDVVVYRMPRTGSTTEFLYNWSDVPAVRMWASGFLNAPDDLVYTDVMPVFDTTGAIQVVGGAGMVIFNANYFNGKFKEQGLGDPDKIELEFFRFATVEDIVRTTIVAGSTNVIISGVVTRATLVVDNASGALDAADGYIDRTLFITDGAEKGERFKIVSAYAGAGSTFCFDVKTVDRQIPDWGDYHYTDGDAVQVTDANLQHDALWKVFWRRGFQMKDPTKPLYCDFEPAATTIQVSPLRYSYDENRKDLDVIGDILGDGAPNFYVVELPNGHITSRNTVQQPIGTWDHDISGAVLADGEDGADIGVYTRVVIQGEGTGNFNVASHKDFGGYAVSGAYKLTDWYTHGTLTQSAADAYIKQILDPDPKTPMVGGSIPYNYGLLFEKAGGSARRGISFADEDLFWVDMGRNSVSGRQWLLDRFELTSFTSFIDGTIINQALRIYFMTEEDYMSATGTSPSAMPGDTDAATIAANMLALKTSYLWKPLLDAFSTSGTETTVKSSSDFLNAKPEKMRFIKVQCAQPWFRLASTGGTGTAHIVLSSLKAWLSRDIIRTVELGVDGIFANQSYVDRAKKLRRRTIVYDKNIGLETTQACTTFGMNELRELSSEFEPRNFTVLAALVDLHDTVRYVDPETGVESNYVVRSVTRDSDDKVDIMAIDYSTFSDL